MAIEIGDVSNDKELIQAVEGLRKKRLEARRAFEAQWWDNIALISGDHYANYNPTTGLFVEPAKEPHQVRLVLNQARVIARTELAKVTKSRPIFEVIPNSPDEEDIAAAKVGRFALDAAEWQFKLKRYRKRALWWTIITGCAAVYVGYDGETRKGGFFELMIDPNTNEPVFDPRRMQELRQAEANGELQIEMEELPLGELEFKLYTPFQILPDDTVFEFDEMADVILTDMVKTSVLKDIYPRARDRIRGSTSNNDSFMTRMLRRANLIDRLDQVASEDVSQVHTYWLPPDVYSRNNYLQNGVMARWTDPELELELIRPYPFSDKRLPLAFFRHTPNATSIWPDTVITDIRQPNLELDKTMSQLLENRDFMLNPMWAIARQLNVAKIKSQPGGVVDYTHVRDVPPPTQLPGVPMPTQIENLVIGLRDQILDISGQGEVSRGRLPAGVRSGVQMSYLQEEDETKLGPVVDEFEDGLSVMGSLILSRMGQFYATERLMRSYRSGGQADIRKFKGADLKGNTDVQVQTGSALPKLKAARQQFAINMAELGVETDPKRLRDILELGEGEPDEVDLAFAQADRENELMRGVAVNTQRAIVGNGDTEAGQGSVAIPVKKWHNHDAHLKRHYRFMSTAEFEGLATTNPDIVRIFDEHTTMHEQAKAELMTQQLQLMAMARGGPESVAPGPEGLPSDNAAEVQRRTAT